MNESRLEFLYKKYVTDTNILDEWGFFEIIQNDPTTIIKDGKQAKVGKYSQWILKQYAKVYEQAINSAHLFDTSLAVFFEDLYKVKEDLEKYDLLKEKKLLADISIRDINNIESFSALYELVKSYDAKQLTVTKAEIKKQTLVKDVELVYEDADFDIIVPKTKAAAIAVSGPPLTRWCTATDNYNNRFEFYNQKGKLYIIRNVHTQVASGRGAGMPLPLWQFHFETQTFMDTDDKPVNFVNILTENKGLKFLFKALLKELCLNNNTAKVKYPLDLSSKYILLYGFEDFFESLPDNIKHIDIEFGTNNTLSYRLPDSIKRFKNLESIYIEGCVSHIPDCISELTSLINVSFPNNRTLKTIPESLATLPKLQTLNLKDSNVTIPNVFLQLDEADKIYIVK